ncbi:hypothetical protein BDF21DRAFT_399041 [Thamnidium elegans]|nr:hypothetical protein BDF21DRAFT_399041 [Thamnidium elegans]
MYRDTETFFIHGNLIIGNGLNYQHLKHMLNIFYYLQSIRINDHIAENSARRVIASLPMYPSTVELKLYRNLYVSLLLEYELQTASKRSIVVIDESLKKRKRGTTPPPLKQALLPLKAEYEANKAELCKIMSIPFAQPRLERAIQIRKQVKSRYIEISPH